MATKNRVEGPGPSTGMPARRGRAGGLKTLARRGLADSIAQIVEALVAKSVEGSVVHLKLLMELAGVMGSGAGVQGKGKRRNTVGRMLLEEWTSGRGVVEGKVGWDVVSAESEDGGVHGV